MGGVRGAGKREMEAERGAGGMGLDLGRDPESTLVRLGGDGPLGFDPGPSGLGGEPGTGRTG